MTHLLINQQAIASRTEASVFISWDKIRPSAEESQIEYTLPVLCQDLYDELLLQDSTSTLTPENEVLKQRVLDALVWWTLYKALPFIQYELRSKGLMQHLDETGTSVNGSAFSIMQAGYRSRGEFYNRQLIKFLNDNIADYPLFMGCCNCTGANGTKSLPGGIMPRRHRPNTIFDW